MTGATGLAIVAVAIALGALALVLIVAVAQFFRGFGGVHRDDRIAPADRVLVETIAAEMERAA